MTIIKQFHVYFKHFDGCERNKKKILSSSQQINNSSNVIFIALSIQPRNRNFVHSSTWCSWYYLSYELFFHQFSCLMDCYIFTFYFHEIKTFPQYMTSIYGSKEILPFVLDFIFWGSFFRFFFILFFCCMTILCVCFQVFVVFMVDH